MGFTRYSSHSGVERIDTEPTKAEVVKKTDGFCLYIGGFVRYLTFWEGLQYRVGWKSPNEYCPCELCQRKGVGLGPGCGR